MFGLENNEKKLSTESYKGVRDFYPEDKALQNYIFRTWQKTAESWGYIEYNASVLEPLELYRSKTSEEIINEQIYSFTDRGEREVALRPEMTPTAARMIAGKINEIPLPARWYSIPNLFRYEKPQRGRVREHWQLNADLFGIDSPYADFEIISMASDIMKKFGAKQEDFEIQINSRDLMNVLYKKIGIENDEAKIVSRIIDKKEKISKDAFKEALEKEVGDKSHELINILESKDGIFEALSNSPEANRLAEVISMLEKSNISNIKFVSTLVRGFDYYTGIVFEVFDANKENPRSLFGGGRYNSLLKSFGSKDVPAIGFGMGDVTIADFLQTHNLLPELKLPTEVWVAIAPETSAEEVYKLANELREKGIKIGIDISFRKLGDQIAGAEKRNIPIILPVGKNELESANFTVRRLSDRVEKQSNREGLFSAIKELLNVSV